MCFDRNSRDVAVGRAVEAAKNILRRLGWRAPAVMVALRDHELVHVTELNCSNLSATEVEALRLRAFHRAIQGSHSGVNKLCTRYLRYPDNSGYVARGNLSVGYGGSRRALYVTRVAMYCIGNPMITKIALQI